MSIACYVTAVEAEALVAEGVEGIEGRLFTYNPRAVSDILASVAGHQEAWDQLSARLVAIAGDTGSTDAFFKPKTKLSFIAAETVPGDEADKTDEVVEDPE